MNKQLIVCLPIIEGKQAIPISSVIAIENILKTSGATNIKKFWGRFKVPYNPPWHSSLGYEILTPTWGIVFRCHTKEHEVFHALLKDLGYWIPKDSLPEEKFKIFLGEVTCN